MTRSWLPSPYDSLAGYCILQLHRRQAADEKQKGADRAQLAQEQAAAQTAGVRLGDHALVTTVEDSASHFPPTPRVRHLRSASSTWLPGRPKPGWSGYKGVVYPVCRD